MDPRNGCWQAPRPGPLLLRAFLLLAASGLAAEPDLSTPAATADAFYASAVRSDADAAAHCLLTSDRPDFTAQRGALRDEWAAYAAICSLLRLGAPPPAEARLPVPILRRDVFRYGDLARVRTIVTVPLLGTVHAWVHCRLTEDQWLVVADPRDFLRAATPDWHTTESPHVRYHHSAPGAIPPAAIEYHERHLARLHEVLDLTLPERLDYFYAGNETEAHWIGCAGNKIDWGRGTCVGATTPRMAHEITHAALPFQQGEDWIGEGLAECYGSDWDLGSPEHPLDPRTRWRAFLHGGPQVRPGRLTTPFDRHLRTSLATLLVANFAAFDELYIRSGTMVQFLAERYGLPRLRVFIHRASLPTIEADLREVYDLTPAKFEQEWTAWLGP